MSRSNASRLPSDLGRARTRLEAWRKNRARGQRIPKALWSTATRLARKHGVARTATLLKLDYYALQRRAVEAEQSELTFVEVAPPPSQTRECVIELEDGLGASMRVSLKGYDAGDVVALGHHLWNTE